MGPQMSLRSTSLSIMRGWGHSGLHGADMSFDQSAVLKARRLIFETASKILSGAVLPIEGARIIAASRFAARLQNDPDILPFVGIDSETDALPLGNERKHWQAQALAGLQPRIDQAQQWAREFGSGHCQNLLARSDLLQGTD